MLGLGLGLTAWRRPRTGTLLLGPNFLSPLLTFARASGATDTDAAGNLVVYGENEPRYGYDPATGIAGWLLEGTSTNLVRNPRCEGGNTSAPIGSGGSMPTFWVRDTNISPSDIVTTFLGSGIENGMPYGDFRFQTSGASGKNLRLQFEQHDGIAASSGQSWVLRYDYKLLAGALPNTDTAKARLIPRDSAQSSISGIVDSILTVDGTRRTATVVMAAAPANTAYISGNFEFGWDSGQAFDFTIRIYSPQIEQTYYSSSLILPPIGVPAAATRAPDSLSITGSAFASLFGAGAPQGCVVVDVFLPAGSGFDLRTIFSLDDGTSANRLDLRPDTSGTSLVAVPFFGGSQGSNPSISGTVYGTQIRAGLRWGQGSIGICLNGVSIDNRTATLAAFNAARFGNTVLGTSPMNGRLRLARALAYAPSDAEFKFICTPGT